jgi:hypothetical protein
MSLAMSKAERESFLAVSGERTIAVPVWYAYEPGGRRDNRPLPASR